MWQLLIDGVPAAEPRTTRERAEQDKLDWPEQLISVVEVIELPTPPADELHIANINRWCDEARHLIDKIQANAERFRDLVGLADDLNARTFMICKTTRDSWETAKPRPNKIRATQVTSTISLEELGLS